MPPHVPEGAYDVSPERAVPHDSAPPLVRKVNRPREHRHRPALVRRELKRLMPTYRETLGDTEPALFTPALSASVFLPAPLKPLRRHTLPMLPARERPTLQHWLTRLPGSRWRRARGAPARLQVSYRRTGSSGSGSLAATRRRRSRRHESELTEGGSRAPLCYGMRVRRWLHIALTARLLATDLTAATTELTIIPSSPR